MGIFGWDLPPGVSNNTYGAPWNDETGVFKFEAVISEPNEQGVYDIEILKNASVEFDDIQPTEHPDRFLVELSYTVAGPVGRDFDWYCAFRSEYECLGGGEFEIDFGTLEMI